MNSRIHAQAREEFPAFCWGLMLLLILLAGCSGATRFVRLDTGESRHRVLISRIDSAEPVRLMEGDFQEAVSELALDVRPVSRPLEHARRLFQAPAWSAYRGTRGSLGLVSVGLRKDIPREHLSLVPVSLTDSALTSGYDRWCARKSRPGDCLRLLDEDPALRGDGRYSLAMAIAMESVWDGTKAALGGMADPVAVQATLVSGMAMYMMLWVLPEPVSKGLAAALTVSMVAWLGVSTVWDIIQGWIHLVETVDRATTFDEVQAAGERFGKVLGHNAARIFVMLATASLGRTVGLAAKAPGLPGHGQAVVVAEAQAGVRLAAVSQVESVAFASEGFTIVLAPGAVAMTAWGSGGVRGGLPGYRAFKSFKSFKSAMGPAGQGKNWHHIVEQTEGNVQRFGPEALHNTENVIRLEAELHSKVSALYSSIRFDITNSTMTVRKWLSTQSYEAQREFGLRAIDNVSKGLW